MIRGLRKCQGNLLNLPKISQVVSRNFSNQQQQFKDSDYNNISPQIWDLTKRKIYQIPNHPINIVVKKVEEFFLTQKVSKVNIPGEQWKVFSGYDPLVSVEECFEELDIGPEHPSRRPTDTYFNGKDYCLRPHTSVYELPLLREGNDAFLVLGDVYRKDTVDRSHYPVFHQLEGVRAFKFEDLGAKTKEQAREKATDDLKEVLENLARFVFGDVDMRWVHDNFPWTDPSLELEIYYNNEWLEILGSGVLTDNFFKKSGKDVNQEVGWAFGLGLERWAMKLFEIDDIRLFWSTDARFLKQFEQGQITKFKPYSKYPSCYKDISFWVDASKGPFSENNFCQLLRNICGDLAESVELIDTFPSPQDSNLTSMCYRINYRHMDRSLTNSEVDSFQMQLREQIENELDCKLR